MQDGVPCSACGRRHFVLEAERGEYNIALSPISTILEGDPDDPGGRRVESRPASGGAADSVIAADGTFEATLTGPLKVGRAGERGVAQVLASKLREVGYDIEAGDDARDDFGEDEILLINGRRTTLQVVTVPSDPAFWKKLNLTGEAALSENRAAALSILRDAIVAKSLKTKGNVLALDVAHVAAIVSPALVKGYLDAFGNPAKEFDFHSVWLVGPTARSTMELR